MRLIHRALVAVEEAAREVDALFDGPGPGRWRYAGRRITDEAAEPLLILHDCLNDAVQARRDPAMLEAYYREHDAPAAQHQDGR